MKGCRVHLLQLWTVCSNAHNFLVFILKFFIYLQIFCHSLILKVFFN